MSHWNYRKIKIKGMISIHEVHYSSDDDSKPISYTENPSVVMAERDIDLQQILLRMSGCCGKKTLKPKDFK